MEEGGWSGNEDIIAALRESKSLFFYMLHSKWERGGHFYFEVDPETWNWKGLFKEAVKELKHSFEEEK